MHIAMAVDLLLLPRHFTLRGLCCRSLRQTPPPPPPPPPPPLPARNMPHIALAACSPFPFHQRTEQSEPLSRNTGLGLMARAGLALSKHNASLSQCKRKVRRDDAGAISSHLVDCSTNLAIYLFSSTSSSSSDELFASNVS
ncbi:hypothetical protein HN011_006603 [Eciton burchellii]|nr:hypothetical protein HN011_006603 [Eciton burchellii]